MRSDRNPCRWAWWLVVVMTSLGMAPVSATASTSRPATDLANLGPDVVMMKELAKLYEPVPFAHRAHAQMAQMWDGCLTCHHRTPQPTTQPVVLHAQPTQAAAAQMPACKNCHPAEDETPEVQMPTLKGAYHRQCLNCHRDWMHDNACVICHKARDGQTASTEPATPDDITGRMHPPIPPPQTKTYKVRFTPAAGGNVTFRHQEHTNDFGVPCVNCHHRDTCARCHDGRNDEAGDTPLRPSQTWRQSHEPCVGCHQQDRCARCHYRDDQAAPKPFAHQATGQALDADHAKLACAQCHPDLKRAAQTTCGDAKCHKPGRLISYPLQRPGPVVSTRPATQPGTAPAAAPPATQPATAPILRRIRARGLSAMAQPAAP